MLDKKMMLVRHLSLLITDAEAFACFGLSVAVIPGIKLVHLLQQDIAVGIIIALLQGASNIVSRQGIIALEDGTPVFFGCGGVSRHVDPRQPPMQSGAVLLCALRGGVQV